MPSLKSLRLRIASVQQTQKITRAMQMVAASKLRRAQERAESARPYAERMERMLGSLAESVAGLENAPELLAGTGEEHTHLLLPVTSDRGLCGAFNSSITRAVRTRVGDLQDSGKAFSLLCLGRKGRDQLRREFGEVIIDTVEGLERGGLSFDKAEGIAERLIAMLDEGAFDVCTIVYNKFRSVMRHDVTFQNLIPLSLGEDGAAPEPETLGPVYEFEPEEEEILKELLPRNLAVQVFHALLESSASEQGARMIAMDNATRNAGEMIDGLTLLYNRTRQAAITKEMVEIVSGAEAL
ncbi:MAG: F0F1 ATP synthase subunit gamma [Alphaproteobacteria bacterium]